MYVSLSLVVSAEELEEEEEDVVQHRVAAEDHEPGDGCLE
jgi:hypothetical protein